MLSSKRKNVTKDKIENNCCDCGFVIALTVLLGAVIASLIAIYLCSGPKYEVGDCLLNRANESVVVEKYPDSGNYKLRYTKYSFYNEYSEEYIFVKDWDRDDYQRETSYVDKHYIKIPCER